MKPLLTIGEIVLTVLVLGTLTLTILQNSSQEEIEHASRVQSPQEVISKAQETFQVNDCIGTISPRVVLTESGEGYPEAVLLPGDSVTNCFPELSQFQTDFREGSTTSGVLRLRPPLERKSFQRANNELETSVVVIPPTPKEGSNTEEVLSSQSTGTPSRGSDPILPTFSGGSTGVPPAQEFPSEDEFEFCRKKVFGDRIPEILTPDELSQMEVCLSEGI